MATQVKIHFSDFFGVSQALLDDYGAFNVSLINDLPLFVDPFLLFNSRSEEYRNLHAGIIKYVRFLRDKTLEGPVDEPGLAYWFTFPEVKQNWLGYSLSGNDGTGLGMEFARALHANLATVFATFGSETITQGSHIEKLTLIESGVGRDNISDFTTNLILEYLLTYTQEFAQKHLNASQRRPIGVGNVRFNYETESWESGEFLLPFSEELDDYVLLTPKAILTKDETWISRRDLFGSFRTVVASLPNDELRARLNNYLLKALPQDAKAEDVARATADALREFPDIIEYYIRYKEQHGSKAAGISSAKVYNTEHQFVHEVRDFANYLASHTQFYSIPGRTYAEAMKRLLFLKDVIENKGGHRVFYDSEERPIRRESDLHILYRMTWCGTELSVTREANDGRGPADFKVSYGAADTSLVEFKLASNTKLKRNLQNQTAIYKLAADAGEAITAIVYFDERQLKHVREILRDLGLSASPHIVLIDARADNKPSGSNA